MASSRSKIALVARIGAYLVGALICLLGGALVVKLRRDIPVDVLSARWAGGASRFVAVGGMQVHYRDEGTGPAVVLLHGTGSSLHTWEGWADALRGKYRVVRFDLPAFGLTGPSPSRDYSLDAYVAFVERVVAALKVDRFVLGGNSLGGAIAWKYALSQIRPVRGLILVDAGGYPVEGKGEPLAFRMARWPLVPSVLARLDPRAFVEDGLAKSYGDPSHVGADVVERYYEMALRTGNRAAFVDRMRTPRQDESPRIRDVAVPTLVMWGARDRVVPVEAARMFASDIPGAKLVVYDDLGHVPMEEDPQRTVADVERFLSGLPANPP